MAQPMIDGIACARIAQNRQAHSPLIRTSAHRARQCSREPQEHDLKVAVQAALKHQIKTYESHIGDLLRTIASCCAFEGYSAAPLAELLRECAPSSDVPLDRQWSLNDSGDYFSTSSPKPPESDLTSKFVEYDSPVASMRGNCSFLDLTSKIDEQDTTYNGSDEAPWVYDGTSGAKTSKVMQDCSQADVAQLRREFTEFADHTLMFDKMHHPVPEYVAMLGSRAVALYELLQSTVDAGPPRTCSARVVGSIYFHLMSSVVIVLNMFVIVLQTDYSMKHLGQPEKPEFKILEYSFTVYYLIELILAIMAFRLYFFIGPDRGWNWFDVFVVSGSLGNLLVDMFGADGLQLSFLRMLRFLKISRVVRMFHALRMFKEIRLMVETLVGCLAIFSLCSVMLLLFVSIFAILFVQGMAVYLESGNADSQVRDTMLTEFGSVGHTMLKLLMAMTGGEDWQSQYDIVKEIGGGYPFLYVFFIVYALFAFCNVIVGVFCEKTINLSIPSLDELMEQRKLKAREDAYRLQSLLRSVFGERRCDIDEDAFNEFLDDPLAAAYFENRGVTQVSAKRFFLLLLEMHQTESVDFGTFISACLRLEGAASSMDIFVLGVEMRALQMMQHKAGKALHEEVAGIREKVVHLQDKPVSDHNLEHLSKERLKAIDRIDSAVKHVLDKRVIELQAMVEPNKTNLEAKEQQEVARVPNQWASHEELESYAQMKAACNEVKAMLNRLVIDMDGVCERAKEAAHSKHAICRTPLITPREWEAPPLRRYDRSHHADHSKELHLSSASMLGATDMLNSQLPLGSTVFGSSAATCIGQFKGKILRRVGQA